MKKIISILFFVLFTFNSGNAQSFWDNLFGEKKVEPTTFYTSDLTMKYEAGEECAYYDGKRFTGKVYSLDESCYMVFKNGVATEAIGFHSNGTNLFEADFPYDKINIWINNNTGKGIIKAVFDSGEWSYYNRLKPNKEKGTIPWISPSNCVSLLSEYYISLSMIEACFKKLPHLGSFPTMPREDKPIPSPFW